MKLNKIISLAVACFMLISCVSAFANTATATTESGEPVTTAYTILTGNPNIASYTDDGTGTYVAKAVLGGTYANTQGALYQYGDGSDRVALTLDSTTGKFSANKILRFTSTVKMTVAATHMTFNTPYLKNGGTNVFGTTVNGINYRPKAGDTIVIDAVVDLNTLTTYYYVGGQLVGSDTFTATSGATSLDFYKTNVYIGNNTVTTAGTELYKVSNIKKTEYPAGTTLASVQKIVTDVYVEKDTTPVSLMTHRYTVSAKAGSTGVYEMVSKHGTAFHGSVAVPMNDTEINSTNTGHVRASFTFTPVVNMYYTANKFNVVRYEDTTKIGGDQISVPTAVALPSIGTNSVKYDVILSKATGEAKYYVNGKLVGTNTYNASTATNASATITAKYLAFYTGNSSVPIGTKVAEISDCKFYNYPAESFSFADIEALVEGNTGVYTEVITPATRGNVTLSSDTTHTIFTSQAKSGASDAPNSRISLKEPIVFGTTTDKYVVFNSKIKFTKHTNDFAFNMTLFDAGSNRVAGNAFAVQQGDEYVAKVIVDVANKKAYFYMDNFLVSTNDITISQVNLLAFFMNNYDDEKAGLQAGEVVYGQSDLNAVHYTSEYTGTLSDVVAAEIGSDIENCSLRTAMYSEYGANDNKTEEFMAENYRLAVIANNFNVEDYKCIIAGYNLDEDGNEILAFTKKIHTSNYVYDAIPKDFDVLKVFLWDNSNNPVMKVYYPELCRR